MLNKVNTANFVYIGCILCDVTMYDDVGVCSYFYSNCNINELLTGS